MAKLSVQGLLNEQNKIALSTNKSYSLNSKFPQVMKNDKQTKVSDAASVERPGHMASNGKRPKGRSHH